MLVQYEETDWQFLRRVASRLNRYLVADYTLNMPYISIGMPSRGGGGEIDSVEVTMKYAVSDESSMDDVVVEKGCSPVTNDPKVKTIVLSAYTREPAWNIQNKTHWCYATAALIMVSSSIDVQDYKYMKPSIKNELDEYRKGEKVFYKFADGSMIALTEYK